MKTEKWIQTVCDQTFLQMFLFICLFAKEIRQTETMNFPWDSWDGSDRLSARLISWLLSESGVRRSKTGSLLIWVEVDLKERFVVLIQLPAVVEPADSLWFLGFSLGFVFQRKAASCSCSCSL